LLANSDRFIQVSESGIASDTRGTYRQKVRKNPFLTCSYTGSNIILCSINSIIFVPEAVDLKAGEYRASGRTAKIIFVRAKQLIQLA